MTTAKLSMYIGMHATHRPAGLYNVSVKIQDMRISYGKENALIQPLAGSGSAWVLLDSLSNIKLAQDLINPVEGA